MISIHWTTLNAMPCSRKRQMDWNVKSAQLRWGKIRWRKQERKGKGPRARKGSRKPWPKNSGRTKSVLYYSMKMTFFALGFWGETFFITFTKKIFSEKLFPIFYSHVGFEKTLTLTLTQKFGTHKMLFGLSSIDTIYRYPQWTKNLEVKLQR